MCSTETNYDVRHNKKALAGRPFQLQNNTAKSKTISSGAYGKREKPFGIAVAAVVVLEHRGWARIRYVHHEQVTTWLQRGHMFPQRSRRPLSCGRSTSSVESRRGLGWCVRSSSVFRRVIDRMEKRCPAVELFILLCGNNACTRTVLRA